MYADPANVLDDLAENDSQAYEWVMKKYDSYLDDAPFSDGSAKADQLKQICVQEYVVWTALNLQVRSGVVIETNEPDGDALGDRTKENPVDLPLDRMQRTVSQRLKELGVLDDEAGGGVQQSKADAIRELMAGVDEAEESERSDSNSEEAADD
ncbi:hypothetical protein [Halalkalicoccus salilacus]|uniref:hypothetical protein n=1 Tax=Halalkalicoccus sp. GCM10025704 TaxID=3252662 RepID=UPI0036F1FFF9